MKNRLTTLAMATLVAVSMGSALAMSATHHQLQSQAKISMSQARSKATAVVHGKIMTQELETEVGGSGLRYTFDIKTASGTHEVGIDAKTGAVIENSIDHDTKSDGDGEKSDEK